MWDEIISGVKKKAELNEFKRQKAKKKIFIAAPFEGLIIVKIKLFHQLPEKMAS
jgi:hypothetical protein